MNLLRLRDIALWLPCTLILNSAQLRPVYSGIASATEANYTKKQDGLIIFLLIKQNAYFIFIFISSY